MSWHNEYNFSFLHAKCTVLKKFEHATRNFLGHRSPHAYVLSCLESFYVCPLPDRLSLLVYTDELNVGAHPQRQRRSSLSKLKTVFTQPLLVCCYFCYSIFVFQYLLVNLERSYPFMHVGTMKRVGNLFFWRQKIFKGGTNLLVFFFAFC